MNKCHFQITVKHTVPFGHWVIGNTSLPLNVGTSIIYGEREEE